MYIRDDTKKLHRALQDFYNATGVNIAIINRDLSILAALSDASNCYCKHIQNTSLGLDLCKQSDNILLEACKSSGKPEMRICHAGLMDIAIPIIYKK